MKMSLAEIAKAIQVQNDIEKWQDLEITSVAFDSRGLDKGALFIPLQGEQDGHQYVSNAFENGAVASLWASDHELPVTDQPILVVDDPLTALQKLSQYYLLKINPFVVAVTGSNGKTTTKDMTAAILATQMNVTKTHANFNNEIGVPVTLLNMNPNTEVVVVEMGMDRPGQIEFLSQLATPDLAVITMIGEAHIEFFKTRDKIADAKMEIAHGLKEDGTLIYDGDEPLLKERAVQINQATQTFGRELGNDFYATSVHASADQVQFQVNEWPGMTFTLPMGGEYNVNNALAAMLVGKLMHVKPENMQNALANIQLTANRAQWLTGDNGEAILSDVYNSNPTAVKEVIKTLVATKTTGRHLAVLGDMLELGEASAKLHASLAEAIKPGQLDAVYLVGAEMENLKTQLVADGYPVAKIHHYQADQLAQLTNDLKATLTADDAILMKASHGIHLEKVLAQLVTTK